ncbi:hypothetical protein [Halobacterium jilantaiense]|uniref:Uncharacterized protein n=1 Tax=Halobacterium jilantaiense TaxID=355548 RepID=A0A1I0P8S6_9EURY|nr:hypothetical protein [Halobacterium jilantaiense]SEW09946.1 hypothetical protein SAMN04487945_1439 [Halobacterium jilantaiense]
MSEDLSTDSIVVTMFVTCALTGYVYPGQTAVGMFASGVTVYYIIGIAAGASLCEMTPFVGGGSA